MSRLKLDGVWRTNLSASSEMARASSNQVLMVVAVISASMSESTLAQMSAGEVIAQASSYHWFPSLTGGGQEKNCRTGTGSAEGQGRGLARGTTSLPRGGAVMRQFNRHSSYPGYYIKKLPFWQ